VRDHRDSRGPISKVARRLDKLDSFDKTGRRVARVVPFIDTPLTLRLCCYHEQRDTNGAVAPVETKCPELYGSRHANAGLFQDPWQCSVLMTSPSHRRLNNVPTLWGLPDQHEWPAAWACVRLDRLKSGYRWVHLFSKHGRVSGGAVLVFVEKKLS